MKGIHLYVMSIVFFLVTGRFTGYGQATYNSDSDILYYKNTGKDEDAYRSEMCRLDVYYPEATKDFPVVLWFHGGGLTGGRKEIPEDLKNRGFAVVGVGYRLSPVVRSEQCIKDAAAAIAWVFQHIREYGGDPKQIFVSGHSAGGYLAMMTALDKSYLGEHGVDADNIAGIVPFSGQAITHFNVRKEAGIQDTQPVIDRFAPLWHVRADAPPMLLITGDRDMEMLGRYEENAYLKRMMEISGHQHTELYELEGYGHNMVKPALPLLIREIRKRSAEITAR